MTRGRPRPSTHAGAYDSTYEGGEQLAFDIERMIHAAQVEAAPTWAGAPLHFTVGYHPPHELDAAFEHWQFLNRGVLGAYSLSHMWHRAIAVPGAVTGTGADGNHGFDMFNADLRCLSDTHRHGNCSCAGDLLYQAVCEPCEWHTISIGENTAVESWHDHAFPGWRELPLVPSRIKVVDSSMRFTNQARAWIEEHYPISAQRPGAPIITERRPYGTRHVPGRSPWGGYDLSHTAVDPDRIVEGSKPLHHSLRRSNAADFAPSPATTRTTARSIGD